MTSLSQHSSPSISWRGESSPGRREAHQGCLEDDPALSIMKAYLANTIIVLPGTWTWPFATDSGDVEARRFST